MNEFIAPAALDLGAINTGIYRAIYPRGTCIDAIKQRFGETLILDRNDYQLLMSDRTAKRHMRRGFDRRKMAKRLLFVILKDYFDFPAQDHAQALGFFINRRGFTRLEESYEAQLFERMPDEAWQALPEQVRAILQRPENIGDWLDEKLVDDPQTVIDLHHLLNEDLAPLRFKHWALKVAKKWQKVEQNIAEGKSIGKVDFARKLGLRTLEQWQESGLSLLDPVLADKPRQFDLWNWAEQVATADRQSLAEQMKTVIDDLEKATSNPLASINTNNFDLEEKLDKLNERDTKTHLTHFLFAIEHCADELESGSRHRNKYFEEISDDLAQLSHHSHGYLQHLGLALETHPRLDPAQLTHLLAHINNLELKPLRAYFNDRAHRAGDSWQPGRLADIVSRWFCKWWRVTENKDGKQKCESYKTLLKAWDAHSDKNDIVRFWLGTEPQLTIPPYQSQTNRHPPDCQSLLLNGRYLRAHYPDWQKWLEQLAKGISASVPDFTGLKSGKGKRLVEHEEQVLRQLQFILDRSQKTDSYRLNLIWSQYHGYQKGNLNATDYRQGLQAQIRDSALPGALKQTLDFKEEGSFGHFLNNYYQTRRRARDQRIFLHPASKGRRAKDPATGRRLPWNDQSSLLTLCTHRPRQKQYQMTLDLAAILGLSKDELTKRIKNLGHDDPEALLKSVHGLASQSEKSAKAQKEFRGRLKLELNKALQANKKTSALFKLHHNIQKSARELARVLWPTATEDQQVKCSQCFANLFSYAQIHNLVFVDRSGFSNTCPACSLDNAQRMRDENGHALASRLPALSVRLIDGAVKRMAEYLANEISRRHWPLIHTELKQGHRVSIPLILEQNRFEFEPALAKLKGKTAKNIPQEENGSDDKTHRIQKAAQGISAYSGHSLGGQGELDHIIPRASRYGTLNDEANLIFVSTEDNRQRSNQGYFLHNLHKNYKQTLFGTDDDAAIRQWIYAGLLGPDDSDAEQNFSFGQYFNFTNLDANQQTAFRHALFLDASDPLKEKVVRAIENRNRTFVNGTQRFVAQKIADKLYQLAQRHGLAEQIEFDYFEYPAQIGHPKGTQHLRRSLGIDKEEKQASYSHHIDAHMAFLLAAEDHRDDGAMGLCFAGIDSVWPYDNGGDITAYMESRVPEAWCNTISMQRKASPTGVRPGRAFHRDNFYRFVFFPLWIQRQDADMACYGFSWENSATLKLSKKVTPVSLEAVRLFAHHQKVVTMAEKSKDWPGFVEELINAYGQNDTAYITWDSHKIAEYAVQNASALTLAQGQSYPAALEFVVSKLGYQTQKKCIKSPATLSETLDGNELLKSGITLPARVEWQALSNAWQQAHTRDEGQNFKAFLHDYFIGDDEHTHRHKKIRRVFSLPIFNENAHYLQQRSCVDGQPIYQLIADSDSRKDGNKFSRLALSPKGDLIKIVNSAFANSHMFKLKAVKIYSQNDYINIDPNQWLSLKPGQLPEQAWPDGVAEIQYKIDNATRPKIRLRLNDDADDSTTQLLKKHALTKAKNEAEASKLDISTPGQWLGPYTSAGFNQEIKDALKAILSDN